MRVTKFRMRILEFNGPQYVLAALAGVSPSRISEYALGKGNMKIENLVRIAEVLECNPEDLMGWVEDDELDVSDGQVRGWK